MSNEQQDDWVQARTPNDEDFGEDTEESEYGHAYQPEEWDDYASEQSAPVAPPQPRVRSEVDDPGEDQPDEGPHADAGEPDAEPLSEASPSEDSESVAAADGDGDASWAAPEQDVAEPVEDTASQLPGEKEELGYGAVGYGGVVDDAEEPDPALEETAVRAPVGSYDAPEYEGEDDLPADLSATDEGDAAEPEPAGSEDSVFQDPDAEVAPAPEIDPEPVAGQESYEADDSSSADSAPEAATAATDESAEKGEFVVTDESAETEESAPEEDLDATQAIPAPVFPDEALLAGEAPAPASEPSPEPDALDQVFRADQPTSPSETPTEQIEQPDGPATGDQTQVLAPAAGYPELDEQEAEEQRIQEQLAAERQARRERLGVVETSEANASRGPQAKPKRTTDKFVGAFPMFLLRLITAAVVGVTGYQMLTPVEDTAAVFEPTILPEPLLMSWILGFTLAAIAVFLVLGLLQRVVGFLLMVYSIGLLAILRWGAFNPFREQFEGFTGDKELLLAGIGFLLLMVGGGSWGIDGAFRAGRAKAKAERQG